MSPGPWVARRPTPTAGGSRFRSFPAVSRIRGRPGLLPPRSPLRPPGCCAGPGASHPGRRGPNWAGGRARPHQSGPQATHPDCTGRPGRTLGSRSLPRLWQWQISRRKMKALQALHARAGHVLPVPLAATRPTMFSVLPSSTITGGKASVKLFELPAPPATWQICAALFDTRSAATFSSGSSPSGMGAMRRAASMASAGIDGPKAARFMLKSAAVKNTAPGLRMDLASSSRS